MRNLYFCVYDELYGLGMRLNCVWRLEIFRFQEYFNCEYEFKVNFCVKFKEKNIFLNLVINKVCRGVVIIMNLFFCD